MCALRINIKQYPYEKHIHVQISTFHLLILLSDWQSTSLVGGSRGILAEPVPTQYQS